MIIYADSAVCQYHLIQNNLEFTRDIESFRQTQGSKCAVFHIPFPWDRGVGETFESRFCKIRDLCDRVTPLLSELHETTVDFILRNQQENITYFICGVVKNVNSKQWMDWFTLSTYFYKENPILDQLNPYAPKSKTFDILLGCVRPHRTKIHEYVLKNDFKDNVIMTYIQNEINPLQQLDTSNWIWPEGLEPPEKDISWTVSPIIYQGRSMSLSTIVPINIYNETAYTVVAETNYFNHFNFYTEKIVKPILAERLFVTFAGHHYLKNLRNFGFKTFDGIIDESYDNIKDTESRFQEVFKQMKYLFMSPQEEILDKIRPITEYNKKIMLETNWHQNFSREFQDVLLDHTRQN
jgi:hypothetical protein